MAELKKFLKGKVGKLAIRPEGPSINFVRQGGINRLMISIPLNDTAFSFIDDFTVTPQSNDFVAKIGENLHNTKVTQTVETAYNDQTSKFEMEIKIQLDPTKMKDKHG